MSIKPTLFLKVSSYFNLKLFFPVFRYSPGPEWQFQTLFDILKATGNYVREDVVSCLLQLISDSPEIQRDAVRVLWEGLSGLKNLEDFQPLVQVSCWTIGEYGEVLTNPEIPENEVLDLFQRILWSPHVSIVTRYVLVLEP